MIITIGHENLNTDTMTVTLRKLTYVPKIIIDNVFHIPDNINNCVIGLKNNNTPLKSEDRQENFIGFSYESNSITLFTDIVVTLDDTEYKTQISDIWNGGGEESILWYPFGGEKNPEKDFHLEIQIDIPLISQLYSMFKNSDVTNLGPLHGYYMITKLLDWQRDNLYADLYMSFPLIRNLCSDENHVTLIFSQSPLNFCQADIDLKNKEQNLIYQVKLPEKNSCDFYQNFIDLANESKKDDNYSFVYFYIALQKKQKQLHYKLPIYIEPFTYLVKVINKDILKDGDAVLYKTTENYYRLVQLSNSFDNSDFKERNEFYRFIDEESYNENYYKSVANLISVISDGDILQNKGDEIILVQFKENPNKDNVIFPYKDIHFNDLGNYTFIITRRTGNKFSLGKFYENIPENKSGNPRMVIDRDGHMKPIVKKDLSGDYFYYTFIYAKDYDPKKYELVTKLSKKK